MPATTSSTEWEDKLDELQEAIRDLGFIVGTTIVDRDDGMGPLMINIVTGHDEETVEETAVSLAVNLGVEEGMMLTRFDEGEVGKVGEVGFAE